VQTLTDVGSVAFTTWCQSSWSSYRSCGVCVW